MTSSSGIDGAVGSEPFAGDCWDNLLAARLNISSRVLKLFSLSNCKKVESSLGLENKIPTEVIDRSMGRRRNTGSIHVMSNNLPSSKIISSSMNQDLDAGGSTALTSRISILDVVFGLSVLYGRNKAGYPVLRMRV